MSKQGRHFSDNHCTHCGRRFGSRDTICAKCGHPIGASIDKSPPQEEPSEPATIEFTLEDATPAPAYAAPILAERHYIGPQYDRYMKAFSGLRERKSRISFNGSAFLGGPFWFLYRKLDWPGFLGLTLCLAAVILHAWLVLPLYLLEGLFAGLFGDALVRRRVCRLIEQGRTLVEPYRSRHIQKKGGVQAGLTGLSLSLFLILCITWIAVSSLPPVPPVPPSLSRVCAQAGCTELAVIGGKYCHDHICLSEFCVQKRQPGSQYCAEHLWMNNVCADPGCQEETVEGGMYCPEHTCMFEGCVAHRAHDSEFCVAHTPPAAEQTAN